MMMPPGPQNIGAAGLELRQAAGLLVAFYLKAGVNRPRIASTPKHCVVLRHGKDSQRLMIIVRREKAQG